MDCFTSHQENNLRPGVVVHANNPSYTGGDGGSRFATSLGKKVSESLSQKTIQVQGSCL
jgi:hypothetical protein